jgi:hypothetical protein
MESQPSKDQPQLDVPNLGRLTWGPYFWSGRVDLPPLGGRCGLMVIHGGAPPDQPPSQRQIFTFEQFRRSLTPDTLDRMKEMMFEYWRRQIAASTNPLVQWRLKGWNPAAVRDADQVWDSLENCTVVIAYYDKYETDPRNAVSLTFTWDWALGPIHILFVDGEPVRASHAEDADPP